jgi:hypothetical protein
MPSVKITATCGPAPNAGAILLPQGTEVPKGPRLLVRNGSKSPSMLMKAGTRGDVGTSACVSGTDLAQLGGDAATVEYSGVNLLGVVLRDRRVALKLLAALLAFVGTVITAVGELPIDSLKDPFSGKAIAAALVFLVVSLGALASFLSDVYGSTAD